MDTEFLLNYPFATITSLGFYIILISLVVPSFRQRAAGLFVHPSAPQSVHLGGLDAFRGCAALLVAVAHCWYFVYPIFYKLQHAAPWLEFAGNKAVPIFAVLSGFLIYRSLRNASSLTDFRVFVARRFFRIFPLYLVSVIACVFTGQVFTEVSGVDYISFLTAEFFMFRSLKFPGYSNPVTWSLYIEVIFYMIMPAFVAIIRPKYNLFAVPIYIVLVIALIIADQVPGREFQLWKYFVFGILAAELSILFDLELKGILGYTILVAGAFLLIIDFNGPRFDIFNHFGFVKSHVAGFTVGLGISAAMIAASTPHVRFVSGLLDFFPLKLLGTISYSIFMFHPFYIMINFPELNFVEVGTKELLWRSKGFPSITYFVFAFMPGILFCSMITFLLIERPALVYGMRLTRRWRDIERGALTQGVPEHALRNPVTAA